MTIRLAVREDLQAITDIYNQAVLRKFETADTEIQTVESRTDWFEVHNPDKYPIYVLESNKQVIGWLSVSPYRQGRMALRHTAEISYYLDENVQNKGLGKLLVEFIIKECPKLDIKNLFAIILEKNTASVRLLEKFGFKKWAFMPEVADFDGETCGHVYYGINLG